MLILDGIDYSRLINLNPEAGRRSWGKDLWTRWSGKGSTRSGSTSPGSTGSGTPIAPDPYSPPFWTEFELPSLPDPCVSRIPRRIGIGILPAWQKSSTSSDLSGDTSFATGGPAAPLPLRRCLLIDLRPKSPLDREMGTNHSLLWASMFVMLFVAAWIIPKVFYIDVSEDVAIEFANNGIVIGIYAMLVVASLPD